MALPFSRGKLPYKNSGIYPELFLSEVQTRTCIFENYL